ncbi:flagellar hook protein FlgE [Sporosalibacterium faouarense]|uniref:flagellar hook protein FlgE n=1 Tax=Sporosalibacterium faouarense TaxID=516123 RepID=UPI00192CAF17|nr:flagellar hook protein FlgE [Sporosalibacterium faouarense]
MMRSMYSGVSGLRVHQTKMDVIGNNIANVNTIGYKKSQASFQEAFSQVVSGGSAPSGGSGGTNPQQIGLGLKLGAIQTIHTKGATQRTDNPTDLMIDGDGFFMVSNDPNAEERYFTRAGNFGFDVEGNLVTKGGYKVLGTYIGDSDYADYLDVDSTKDLDGIKVSKAIPSPPVASTKIDVSGNLDSRIPFYQDDTDDDGTVDETNNDGKYTTDVYVKDSLGNSYKVAIEFEHMDNSVSGNGVNEWTVGIKEIRGVSNNKIYPASGNWEFNTGSNPQITFDASGKITGDPKFDLDLSDLATNLGVDFGPSGSTNDNIEIDLTKLTQFGNESSAKGVDVGLDGDTGKSSGSVTEFTINETGQVIASFDNGIKMALWQIKLANFDNPAGLVKSGSNFFEKTPNSGEPQLGTAGSNGLGAITPGALEMSNVDLSMEFTEMISTQRGFQANSRIITTTDEMLQELANMKR